MTFTSVSFLFFIAFLLTVYYLVPKSGQWMVLLAASYLFYWNAGIEALALILFTTLATYAAAMKMSTNLDLQRNILADKHGVPVVIDGRLEFLHESLCDGSEKASPKVIKAEIKKRNRFWLILCLIANFSILALCKACLTDPIRSIAQGSQLSFLTVALPLGISFYMFQSMGYLIDVYRGSANAERNPFKLALFVSYFPQLIQGPISKYNHLAPQLYKYHAFNGKAVSFGLQRMLWGYFKKLIVADRIAAAVAALKAPEYTGVGFLVLTVFYALQIYADFTGGIDITIGLSESLGISLPENFIRPFFSKNIAEYWRRWHITLGTWMKDYIFYPISISKPILKLSKKARKKQSDFGKRLPVYIASVITWFVTGIWHGLTPNFVVWGLLNCFVIVLSEELVPLYECFHNRFHLKEKKWYGGFEILRMFFLMNLIRACDLFPNVGDYFSRIGSLFTTFNFHILWDGTLLQLGLQIHDYLLIGIAACVMLAVSIYQERNGSVRELLQKLTPALRYCIVIILFLAVILFGCYGIGYDAGNFIYNQF